MGARSSTVKSSARSLQRTMQASQKRVSLKDRLRCKRIETEITLPLFQSTLSPFCNHTHYASPFATFVWYCRHTCDTVPASSCILGRLRTTSRKWATMHAHTRRDTGGVANGFDRNKGSCWCSYLMLVLLVLLKRGGFRAVQYRNL